MVSKPEMQVKDDKGVFTFDSSDVDTAIISIDSKRDHPEQFEAYKTYIDDLYTDVQPYDSEKSSEEEDDGSGKGSGDGSDDGSDGSGSEVFIDGQQSVVTEGDKTAEEQIDEILSEVISGTRGNSDGYKDEDNYRLHHNAINTEESGLYSLEQLYNWLHNDESDQYVFGNTFSPFKEYDEGIANAKEDIRTFVQGIAFALTRFSKNDAADYFNEHRGSMSDLLNSVTSYPKELIIDCLVNGLHNKNGYYSAFVLDQNSDNSALI